MTSSHFLCAVAALIANCAAFAPPRSLHFPGNVDRVVEATSRLRPTPTHARVRTSTHLFGLFGQKQPAPAPDDDPEKGIPVFELPLTGIKVGGLRVTLSLWAVSQQNTPEKGTWLVHPADDGVLEMWYNPDQSGMFAVVLSEEADGGGRVSVERHGPQPSLAYLLQESLRLHALLDELATLAFGGEEGDDIAAEDRLLRLEDEGAIERARELLPARAD